jgi:predicted ATPase
MTTHLASIGLQNFQTIGSYQELPMGKLTFLYGPNSSGKSSIRDAIETMQELWGDGDEEINPFTRDDLKSSSLLVENRRRVNNKSVGEPTRLVVEVCVKNESDNPNKLKVTKGINNLQEYIRLKNRTSIRGEVRYGQGSWSEYIGRITELLLSVDECPLIRWSHIEGNLSINLRHKIFQDLGYKNEDLILEMPGAVELAKTSENYFKLDQGWLTCKADLHYDRNREINTSNSENLIRIQYGAEDGEEYSEDKEELVDVICNGVDDISNIYNWLIRVFSGYIFDGLRDEIIRGSRDIPNDKDLTFLVSPHKYDKEQEKWAKELSYFHGFSLTGNPFYAKLAAASAIKVIRDYASEKGLDNHAIGMMDIFIERKLNLDSFKTLGFINEALREYLFIDKSYQLTSRLTFLQDIEEYFEKKPIGSFYDIHEILVKLRLKDTSGNMLRIDQVGSGIGYVVPILMGVYSSLDSSKFAVLEQPELHLHPALQSSLCDVFVDACNKGARLIIESHSEHLLLRALRRVRDTSSGRLKTPSLALNAEDMVVLYFEPQINGETKVKRLRVSDDGDFLDRWPNGFFSERDQDLFDE